MLPQNSRDKMPIAAVVASQKTSTPSTCSTLPKHQIFAGKLFPDGDALEGWKGLGFSEKRASFFLWRISTSGTLKSNWFFNTIPPHRWFFNNSYMPVQNDWLSYSKVSSAMMMSSCSALGQPLFAKRMLWASDPKYHWSANRLPMFWYMSIMIADTPESGSK